jgi:gluconate 2-dehydrogenase gamma chain
MEKLSRRSFFKLAGAAAAATAVDARALTKSEADQAAAAGTAPVPQPERAGQRGYVFFKPDEEKFVEAAVARLIPADENGPGALEADVPSFIDRQLAGAWGAGDRLYRSGPWQQGADTQGYQWPFTPAELFHTALRAIGSDLGNAGRLPFVKLSPLDQDAYLKSLEAGERDLDGVPSDVFFESLLALTIEGYFSDPVYGGNKDMAAWKMLGFPGAYASFYTLVDQYGVLYTRPPISMGDDGKGVIHIHPQSAAHKEGQ